MRSKHLSPPSRLTAVPIRLVYSKITSKGATDSGSSRPARDHDEYAYQLTHLADHLLSAVNYMIDQTQRLCLYVGDLCCCVG